GLTARQLQIWDSGGLLSPAVRPRRTVAGGFTERRYTPIDLFELMVLADLRRRGFSVPQLRSIIDTLAVVFKSSLCEATGGGGRVQLLTDGQRIFVRGDDGSFYNLLESPEQPLLVIGEAEVLKELKGKVRRKKRRV